MRNSVRDMVSEPVRQHVKLRWQWQCIVGKSSLTLYLPENAAQHQIRKRMDRSGN